MDRRTVLSMTPALGAAAATLHAGATSASEATAVPQLPRSSYVYRKDGTALFYKDWGAGTPVLFVCSAGFHSDMWGYQMVPFTARGMRCVSFDRRGHGRSSDPGRGYDFDTFADDLASVIESLDLHRLTLVGHSMGCAEIVRYLTRHGDSRVSRVVLLSPTTPFLLRTDDNPQGIDGAVFQQTRAMWLRDFPAWVARNAPPFFVPETSAEMQRWAMNMMYATSLQVHLACNVAVTEADFRDELPRIRVPTLVIHGTQDVSAPLSLTGQRTAQLLPRCELKVYEGAPHGLPFTHAERVNEDVLRFMGA